MNTDSSQLIIKKADKRHLDLIRDVLLKESLPTSDIVLDIIHIYLFYDDKNLIGITGLENFKHFGLLRSVVVIDKYKHRGFGHEICELTITKAAEMGVEELYLLTLAAEGFFKTLGFNTIDREAVPSFIKSTAEFKNLCPETAACMMKRIF